MDFYATTQRHQDQEIGGQTFQDHRHRQSIAHARRQTAFAANQKTQTPPPARHRPAGGPDGCLSGHTEPALQPLGFSPIPNPQLPITPCELPTPPLPASAASARSRPLKAFGCAAPNFTAMPPTRSITDANTPSAIARPKSAISARCGKSASTPPPAPRV